MGTGTVFDVKQYALHDGPGIRTTVFLKGCPLCCRWCHNPEGIGENPQSLYRKRRCIGCGECLSVCPEDALSLTPEGIITDGVLCKSDGACAEICPAEARELIGNIVSTEAIMDIVKSDIPFYNQSGGGVTFSGGEPLMQADFLFECLRLCGRAGIHRAVDTSGYAELEIIKQIAMETDLFLYDLKFMDSEKHRHFTGVSNPLILANLKYLARSGARVTIRFPLIPGINDNDKNIDLMGMFLRILPEIETVHILPYHGYQENKYIHLDTIYMAKNIPPPTLDDLSRVKKRLEGFGLKVDIGG
ncbi:MAG: glycyl-radical enzyme activating protein [Deltaproteobacteria bacterium]|nr:MAG: glycyl-radical enzyme activating protein [Deltaproteobacteria bacterium]RLC17831.1 MAG: glycyl-radical enzyme activating protein [Deltaproteobacteria bacterium]HHE73894.1 glycyl-radical enzyme activating protein [Desulfobacteraceae bacterium]